jgi:2-polyprenyl-3-methyl-5-hydroxy-6-metoxy-1,4-benzoquinol methylase
MSEDLRTAGKGDYISMQRRYYDERATSIEQAQALVHPDYSLARSQAGATQAHALLEYALRSYQPARGETSISGVTARASAVPRDLRLLDFGCGVGRLMEPLALEGYQVDGVDISAKMLEFARSSPSLSQSQFFRSNGNDLGDAPTGAYDLVYSYLCLQHICSRQVRNELLGAFRKALRPNGMLIVQIHFYRDHRADTVPAPHVPWSADNFGAAGTNSEADVWATPDDLSLIYEDFGRHFQDVRLQFIDFPSAMHLFTEAYQTRFGHLVISGSASHTIASRIYAA